MYTQKVHINLVISNNNNHFYTIYRQRGNSVTLATPSYTPEFRFNNTPLVPNYQAH